MWGVPIAIPDEIKLAGLEKTGVLIADGYIKSTCAAFYDETLSLYVAVVNRQVFLQIEWNQNRTNPSSDELEPVDRIRASYALQEDGTFKLDSAPDASRLGANGILKPYSIPSISLATWETELNERFRESQQLRDAYELASGVRLIFRD